MKKVNNQVKLLELASRRMEPGGTRSVQGGSITISSDFQYAKELRRKKCSGIQSGEFKTFDARP